ncbi:hypothetical protein RJ639_047818 [Escallonia herrerae]|uniref:Protein kinase domain-containing protein n=1 Tax=Escallonia herrerae TaxID=1293975 RepID=A0AA88W5Z4_9ASTE|nr:hypothetical protein RJ639_047818 [Escallonia herrerae]
MDLSQNSLSGYVPKEVFSLSSLSISLDLSSNSLTGSILLGAGDFQNLASLNISNNMLSDEFSSSLGGCTSLTVLFVAGNLFQGGIPQSLSSLRSIEVLDLSRNNLTGEIPAYIHNFLFLLNLNLSFNDFEGEVPVERAFRNASKVLLDGNSKLCGGVPELKWPKCAIRNASNRNKVSHALVLVIPISCGVLVLILVLVSVFVYKRRHTKKVCLPDSSTRETVSKVSYQSLYRATDGFSSANLIGSGKFSSVYKGILEETVIAVKVLNLEVHGAIKSFMAECEALKSIRHRNLVKILTSCSSIDLQGKDFKAIVYAYMVSGSLDEWEVCDPALLHDEEQDHPELQDEEQDETRSKNLAATAGSQANHEKLKDTLVAIFTIGIACSKQLPRERMNIGDVTNRLYSIRDTLLGSIGRKVTGNLEVI